MTLLIIPTHFSFHNKKFHRKESNNYNYRRHTILNGYDKYTYSCCVHRGDLETARAGGASTVRVSRGGGAARMVAAPGSTRRGSRALGLAPTLYPRSTLIYPRSGNQAAVPAFSYYPATCDKENSHYFS